MTTQPLQTDRDHPADRGLGEHDRTRQQWLDASALVVRQFLADSTLDPLRLVGGTLLFAADADCVVVLASPRDGGGVEAQFSIGPRADKLAAHLLVDAPALWRHVIHSGEPLHVRDLHGPRSDRAFAADSMLLLPVPEAGGNRAVLAAVRFSGRTDFTLADLEQAAGFARHAGGLAELSAARATQQHQDTLALRERIGADLQGQISRELFSVGLALYGVAATLGAGPMGDRVAAATIDLDKVIAQVRATALDMAKPPTAREMSLEARLLAVVAELSPTLGFEPTLSLSGGSRDTAATQDILDDVVAALRKILGEVARHGRAKDVTVALGSTDGQLDLVVREEGRFDAGTRVLWSIPTA